MKDGKAWWLGETQWEGWPTVAEQDRSRKAFVAEWEEKKRVHQEFEQFKKDWDALGEDFQKYEVNSPGALTLKELNKRFIDLYGQKRDFEKLNFFYMYVPPNPYNQTPSETEPQSEKEIKVSDKGLTREEALYDATKLYGSNVFARIDDQGKCRIGLQGLNWEAVGNTWRDSFDSFIYLMKEREKNA